MYGLSEAAVTDGPSVQYTGPMGWRSIACSLLLHWRETSKSSVTDD